MGVIAGASTKGSPWRWKQKLLRPMMSLKSKPRSVCFGLAGCATTHGHYVLLNTMFKASPIHMSHCCAVWHYEAALRFRIAGLQLGLQQSCEHACQALLAAQRLLSQKHSQAHNRVPDGSEHMLHKPISWAVMQLPRSAEPLQARDSGKSQELLLHACLPPCTEHTSCKQHAPTGHLLAQELSSDKQPATFAGRPSLHMI